MAETEKDNATKVEKPMTQILDDLNDKYYKKFSKLSENFSFLPEEQYKYMCAALHQQYVREYEQLDGETGIEIDKQIEELKTEREKELAAIELERDKLKKELELERIAELKRIELEKEKQTEELAAVREQELAAIRLERDKLRKELACERIKELAAVELEHEKLTAAIDRQREKLYQEIGILAETATYEAATVATKIVPQTYRKHIGKWEFGKVRYNHAMEFAVESAELEINEYLSTRAQEIAEKRGDESPIWIPFDFNRMSRRAQDRFMKRLHKRLKKLAEEPESDENEAQTPETEEIEETPAEGNEPTEAQATPDESE